MHRGFILQSTYRIEADRPVVFIYGKLESAGSFLIRDTRQTPAFYIRRTDEESARVLGAAIREEERRRVTMRDEAAVRVEVRVPQDVPPLRLKLAEHGIECFEADVPFASRYLIDHGIRASLEIRGSPRTGEGVDAVFDNPEVFPADWSPQLSTLSIDIETDPKAAHLLSVALEGCGASEVLVYSPAGYGTPSEAVGYPGEKELLQAFVGRVRELDPDILTGWNVVDFDLSVLQRIAQRLGVVLTLGRGPEPLRLRPSNYARAPNQASVPGRVVLDGIELLRGAFIRLDSYALDSAARQILGKGKTFSGPDRPAEILRMFKEDRSRFVEYNLNDARLVLEILNKLRLIDLAVERSRLTGMPPDRVSASIASFDFLYLSELSRRGVVAPTVRSSSYAGPPNTGGHVLEPRTGLYRNVLVFDFKSLYPSVVRTFEIDPLGNLPEPDAAEDPIIAPNGAAFRRERGILPRILDDLFPRRDKARAEGDQVASHAIKILMNSFYGVLGTPACRFASPELANAITGFGREILLWSKNRIEMSGYEVLYGDTDSLFVLSGLTDPESAQELGGRLASDLNRDLAEHVRRTWRVESRLELRFERLYLRFLLPAVRHGTGGARKRYAGLIEERGKTQVVFTGMEAVRRDWTELAKQVQRELYLRLFSDRPVEDYLRGVVKEVRAGHLDELLAYRKAVRKELNSYTASTPPHVAAARKMRERRGSLVAYYITENGPEPAEDRRSRMDYEHYVQKQVRAVAEPVLGLLGLDFNEIAGDDPQLKLF
ncbi:MAG TPA: DNA polymerase II [Acidobacteriota bacterium]|nr:DNA polymerase II [Acidobacteriota bacterium]